ncbi:nucleotidyltransferase family protein [Candidatus Woesearchaeota archaeon]|nr:nucleotidyltransferase family protein [Candidatus Woesearchaeota archaeon]
MGSITQAWEGDKIKAIITCAGFATRLWPLTKEVPKPLLEVKGKPIVEHIINKVLELPDVDEVLVVTNEKFYGPFSSWLKDAKFSAPVKLLNDGSSSNDDRLGQIGDVLFGMKEGKVDDDIIVVAGDNLFNFSLMDAYKKFKDTKSVVNPLYDIRSLSAAKQLGTVVLADDTSFLEFFEKAEMPKSTLVSLGIYFFAREKAKLINQYLDSGENPDKMGYFLTWLIGKDRVFGHTYYEKWFDIGWIKSLEEARRDFEP